jgi:RNA polymerase sigma factor (sigma-70 family)
MPTAPEVADLVNEYIALALSIARRWGRSYPWLADDYASEASFALFRAATRYDPSRGAFGALVRVSVRRALWERCRKELVRNPTAFKRQLAVQNDDGEHVPLTVFVADDLPDVGVELEALDLLDQLPPDRRELVKRVVMGSESAKVAAGELGITRSAVGQRVRRSLDQLRASAE